MNGNKIKKNILKIDICTIFVFSLIGYTHPVVMAQQCDDIITITESKGIYTVDVEDIPKNVMSLGFKVTYDTSCLTYKGFTNDDCLTEFFSMFNVSNPSTGTLNVGGFVINPIEQGSSGCIVRLEFESTCDEVPPICLENLVDDMAGWCDGCGEGDCNGCFGPIELGITTSTTVPANSTSSTTNSTTSTTVPVSSTSSSTTSTSPTSTTTISLLWPMAYDKMWGAKEDENLSLLRAFRDRVLADSEVGRDNIYMLYNNSLEILILLIQNPSLTKETKEVIDDVLPEIESLLDGSEMILSKKQLADFESLLTGFETKASPKLKTAISKIKRDIVKGEMLDKLGIVAVENDTFY